MNNPFQQQLLKAGLVNKKQLKQANQEKARKQKQQRNSKEIPVDETRIKLQQLADEKNRRDRALNKQKQEQARNKAISAEINQLINDNLIKRDDNCDIVYNFEHRKKVNRLYINEEMKQQIMQGKLGIACIEGRYELVPSLIATKIQQRNANRIILFDKAQSETDENDAYADYKVPDDLIW